MNRPADQDIQELWSALAPLEELVQRIRRLHRLKTLQGMWSDLEFNVTEQDIDEARHEAWANFPRADV